MLSRSAYLLLGFIVIAVAWEGAIAAFRIPPYVLPGLATIAHAIWTDLGMLLQALRATLFVAGSGYAIGASVGIALAVAMVLVPALDRAFMPIVVAVNSVPVVAYAPLILVWLGTGPASQIMMVTLAASFTVFINAMQGLRSVDNAAVDLLRSFGAGALRTAWMLRLPAALPAIVNGMRVAAVRSMLIAIVAEMLGASEGLGRVIYESTQQIDFLRVWSAVTVASVASMAIYGLIVWADRRFVWWK
jgi:NitT/TauT family transport system permease protein